MNHLSLPRFSFTLAILLAVIFSSCSTQQYPMYHKENNRVLSFSLKRHAKNNSLHSARAQTTKLKFTENNNSKTSPTEITTPDKLIEYTASTKLLTSTNSVRHQDYKNAVQDSPTPTTFTESQGNTRTAVKQAVKKIKQHRTDIVIDSNTLWTAAAIVLLVFLALIILSNLGAFIYLLLVVVLVLVLLALLGYRV